MELELVFYNDDFKQQLDNYTITDDQLRFTGHPDEAIALAKEDPERHPVVAVRHGWITNFFVLHEKKWRQAIYKSSACHIAADVFNRFPPAGKRIRQAMFKTAAPFCPYPFSGNRADGSWGEYGKCCCPKFVQTSRVCG